MYERNWNFIILENIFKYSRIKYNGRIILITEKNMNYLTVHVKISEFVVRVFNK